MQPCRIQLRRTTRVTKDSGGSVQWRGKLSIRIKQKQLQDTAWCWGQFVRLGGRVFFFKYSWHLCFLTCFFTQHKRVLKGMWRETKELPAVGWVARKDSRSYLDRQRRGENQLQTNRVERQERNWFLNDTEVKPTGHQNRLSSRAECPLLLPQERWNSKFQSLKGSTPLAVWKPPRPSSWPLPKKYALFKFSNRN